MKFYTTPPLPNTIFWAGETNHPVLSLKTLDYIDPWKTWFWVLESLSQLIKQLNKYRKNKYIYIYIYIYIYEKKSFAKETKLLGQFINKYQNEVSYLFQNEVSYLSVMFDIQYFDTLR